MTILQNNVKAIREQRNFTQKQLAEVCQLSQSRIADIESGRGRVDRITLGLAAKLADALGTSIIELFTTEGE